MDSLPIPRLLRRGIPRELDLSLGEHRNIYDVQRQLSVPFNLRALSGGRFAAFHLDASVWSNNTVMGQVFMTVIPSTGKVRCIDVRVPTHDSTSIPRLAFLADTLFVLDQFARDDAAVTEIRKYHMGVDVC